MNVSQKRIEISRSSVKEFCKRHGYMTAGTVADHRRLMEIAGAGESEVGEIALVVLAATEYGALPDTSYRMSYDLLCAQVDGELRDLVLEESSARVCAERHPDLVSRIVEVAKWSPAITTKVTDDNCVLLESSGDDEACSWVAFRVNGLGFTIDFVEHTASRATAYDLPVEGEVS